MFQSKTAGIKEIVCSALCTVAALTLVPFCAAEKTSAKAEDGIAFTYGDAQVTEISCSVGQLNVDVYYRVGGSTEYDPELAVTSSDTAVVTASPNKVQNRFRLTLHSRGTAQLTAVSGDYSGTLDITVTYEEPGTVKLTYPGESATETITVGSALAVEYSAEGFALMPAAVRSNGANGNFDTENLGFDWEFTDNTCGASYSAEESKLYTTGAGSANVSVWATISGEKVGEAKTFTLTSSYQRVASDIEAVFGGVEITGLVYTVGSDKITLRYLEKSEDDASDDEGQTVDREIELSALTVDYTVSNKAYIDPASVVWTSTNENAVKVENGRLTINTDGLSGSPYYSFTLTVRDSLYTVADNVMVVIYPASASFDGGEKKEGGCGSVIGGAFVSAEALALAGIVLRKKRNAR